MIQKIKRYILLVSAASLLLVPSISIGATAVASAACSKISTTVENGVTNSLPDNTGGGLQDCNSSSGSSTADITNLAKKIITAFSIVVGAASVIMIIYGGFRYIISGGESSRVGAAKNSLIYAIIGLIIVALAQLIIHFVLNQASQIGS